MIASAPEFLRDVPKKYWSIKHQDDLVLVKYSKRAYYDQAWIQYPQLERARVRRR